MPEDIIDFESTAHETEPEPGAPEAPPAKAETSPAAVTLTINPPATTTTTTEPSICKYVPVFLRWLFEIFLHCKY